jgi:error-prone DNA polymerase
VPDSYPARIRPDIEKYGSIRRNRNSYAELQVTSNFSFLTGASHPEELVTTAKAQGLSAIALTDCNSLAGIVRAHKCAKEVGIQFIVGCRLEVQCEDSSLYSLLVYPKSVESYGWLCETLSAGKLRTEKGQCELYFEDIKALHPELEAILLPPYFLHNPEQSQKKTTIDSFIERSKELVRHADARERFSLALVRNYCYKNIAHIEQIKTLSSVLTLPLVATNDVHYHKPERKIVQDVLNCIKHKCTLERAGYKLFPNSERCIKAPDEMWRLFAESPLALRKSLQIAEKLKAFSLNQLRYEYPNEISDNRKNDKEYLRELTFSGAKTRYPNAIPLEVQKTLEEELKLISELQYEKYFLTCYDIVKFARSKNILCQGRGAAANSAVCYCLGITAVDPSKISLLFARFVSKERNEPPDIDIDFEHERREEVIQYIYEKYGRHRAAIASEVVTYRYRSAVREVGKVLGLSLDLVDKLAKSIHGWTGFALSAEDLKEIGIKNIKDPTVLMTLKLAHELLGFPRHLSQHVGGFIISEKPLNRLVPILNASMPERTIIEWDKDDIEELGMLKIDILALGMLTCIRKALMLVNQTRERKQQELVQYHTIPREDPAVYDMICKADTIGVFQIESRAQMQMLPRLKPRCFYDLVIEVAIVRPGPIQGNMVHPFLKRRNGLEKAVYPDKEVEAILGKTLGVPIFQEQAMRLAIVLAGFSPGEAEQLRRAMASWKRNKDVIATFKTRIIKGMISKGYSAEFADSVMNQIKGFSEYGFPESHAASFANLVYASCWLKRHYPAEFAAALLNSQPMGFYAPAQIIADAKEHGVEVKRADLKHSDYNCGIEYERDEDNPAQEKGALRIGLRLIRGLGEVQVEALKAVAKSKAAWSSLASLWNQSKESLIPIRRETLTRLARADALRSFSLGRRQALWEIKSLPKEQKALDGLFSQGNAQQVSLPGITKHEAMFKDYDSTGFSLRGHPIGFLRSALSKQDVQTAKAFKERNVKIGREQVKVAGLSIFRQRPGTAKGVLFISLEDETGISNLIVKPKVFEKYQRIILYSTALLAYGTLERSGDVVYIMARHIVSLDKEVMNVSSSRTSIDVRSYSY